VQQERGFALALVLIVLTVAGGVALVMTRESTLSARMASTEIAIDHAAYLAEAGYQHALWLARRQNCVGYPSLVNMPLDGGTYSVTVTPSSGSPVTIESTASLLDGTTQRVFRRTDVPIVPPPTSMTHYFGPELDDAYLRSDQPAQNFGAATTLRAKSGSSQRPSVLRFDLSVLPAGTLNSVRLSLYVSFSAGGEQVHAHRLLASFVEGTQDGGSPPTGVTWTKRNSTTNWATPGGDYDPVPAATTTIGAYWQRYEWDITTLVQGWVAATYPNYGLILRGGAGADVMMTSSDEFFFVLLRPRLMIDYTPAC
jgi:hypothetical protein